MKRKTIFFEDKSIKEAKKLMRKGENFSSFARKGVDMLISFRKTPLEFELPRYNSLIDANDLFKVIARKFNATFDIVHPDAAQQALAALSSEKRFYVESFVTDYCRFFDGGRFILEFFKNLNVFRFCVHTLATKYFFYNPHFEILDKQLQTEKWVEEYKDLMDYLIMVTKQA